MKDPTQDVMELRSQGLPDTVVMEELGKKGYDPQEVQMALSQSQAPAGMSAMRQPMGMPPQQAPPQMNGHDDAYGRMEEIAESIIDQKWDELIAEVKKIIEWKEKVEQQNHKMSLELTKLKEDFTTLHQGVLGKLEDYDTRMRDVGTELGAVGKVFKDVIPEFVENVKELKAINKGHKRE